MHCDDEYPRGLGATMIAWLRSDSAPGHHRTDRPTVAMTAWEHCGNQVRASMAYHEKTTVLL